MAQADPQQLRIRAVEALVNQYSNDPAVHFGFLRFQTNPNPLPDLGYDFTNNQQRIQGAITQLLANNTLQPGATNYQAALEWAWDAIDQDQRRPDNVPGTRYGILFVTDGRPNEPEQGGADAALAANRPKVRDRITGCDGWKAHKPLESMIEFLNTYFINIGGRRPACGGTSCGTWPRGPAWTPAAPDNWGHGTYTEVQNAGDLNFRLDLPTLRKVFVNRSGFVFFNHHVKAVFQNREMVMARDSDGDGLADFLESANPDPNDPWATSMFSADTDGNGSATWWAGPWGRPPTSPTPRPSTRAPPPRQSWRRRGCWLSSPTPSGSTSTTRTATA
jgi:hypothetical protein